MADIKIVHANNMEVMAGLKDKEIQLAIVDPPYAINAPKMQMGSQGQGKDMYGYRRAPTVSSAERIRKNRLSVGGGNMKNSSLVTMATDWDNEPPPPEYFKELERVSVNRIIFGGNYFPLPPTRCVVCWDKRQNLPTFSAWEMAWTSFEYPAVMIRLCNTGGANLEKKIHPTQKPVELYRRILARFAKPGDKILDTHLGSASSSIAAYQLGFDFLGCEIDEHFFKDAEKRLKMAQAQGSLYQDPEVKAEQTFLNLK